MKKAVAEMFSIKVVFIFSWNIYIDKLDKACLAHGDYKNLSERTALDKLLQDKAFNITKKSITW